ncbi:MAG: histidinol-phosphate transaminase [Pseudomonadota bacterium]
MENSLPIKEHLIKLERVLNATGAGPGYLRLEKNEGLVPFPKEFIQEIQRAITADYISKYPELSSLYGSIAGWVGQNRENIYLTAGSDAAIKTVFEVFVSPGDKIAILHPTYAMYYVYARMFQAKLLEIECKEDLSFSVDEILSCIKNEKLRLICLANPNSPTGTVIPPDRLEEIIKLASEHSTVVLVDEAYYLFYPESSSRLVNQYPNLVVTRTFSKALGLASARLGFVVGSKDMIAALHKVRPMYEVNALGAIFVEKLLEHPEIIDRNISLTLAGKKYLEAELDKLGLRYFKSQANFVLIEVGSFERSSEIVKKLRERKILIKGSFGHKYLRNCIRVTVGTSEQMSLFIKELKDILRS